MPGRSEQADFGGLAAVRPMAARTVPAHQADRAGLRGGAGAVSCQGFLDSLMPPDSRELDKVDGGRC